MGKKLKITTEQIDLLASLREAGLSYAKIAKMINRSAEYVRKILKERENQPKINKGKCYDDYLREAGLPPSSYYRKRNIGFRSGVR